MYHVSTQGVDERMINVHYYYYYSREGSHGLHIQPPFGLASTVT